MMEVQELARLWLETQGRFASARHREVAAFEKALDEYLNGQVHLVEAFPFMPARRERVMAVIRAMARQIRLVEAEQNGEPDV